MPEFYIKAYSFAAPFCSDTSDHYVEARCAVDALGKLADMYGHPAGLYSANAYASHKDYVANKNPLATWRCNLQAAIEDAAKGLGSYSLRDIGGGQFEIDGKKHTVKNWREGHAEITP